VDTFGGYGNYDRAILTTRFSAFLRDFQRGKYVDVVICGSNPDINSKRCRVDELLVSLVLGPTAEDGIVKSTFNFTHGGYEVYSAVDLNMRHDKIMKSVPKSHIIGRRPVFNNVDRSARITLVPYTGVSVISDIDDTIKVTNVGNIPQLLENTFAKEFVVVPEVYSLYKQWVSDGSRDGKNSNFDFFSC
jgi:hypothetical protein